MNRKDYTRYTGTSYTSRFRNPLDAIRLELHKPNNGKVRTIILEDGTYGVMQNSLAKKFIAAGYKPFIWGFKEVAQLGF